jgi:hypothetical protein
MTMKDMGSAQDFRGLQHGAREQGEAFGVIGIVPCGSSVQGVAVEIWRIFDKIETHTCLSSSGNDRGKTIFVVEWNGYATDDRGGIAKFGLPVTREIDSDLMPEGGESTGQSAHDVGQAAGLGKRDAFRSGKCDIHECGTSSGAYVRWARYDEVKVTLRARVRTI